VKWFAWLFNGHSNGSVEAWFTHFALLLTDSDSKQWLIERNEDGVRFELVDAAFYSDYVHTLTWNAEIAHEHVRTFVDQQQERPYSFVSKNCKHLVYDFLRFHTSLLGEEEFPSFCQRAEAHYRREI
jgi:hypothetical protein